MELLLLPVDVRGTPMDVCAASWQEQHVDASSTKHRYCNPRSATLGDVAAVLVVHVSTMVMTMCGRQCNLRCCGGDDDDE